MIKELIWRKGKQRSEKSDLPPLIVPLLELESTE